MSGGAGLHLILGGAIKINGRETHRLEEFLAERALRGIVRDARASAGTEDVPVDQLRAGEVSVGDIAELLSPSLFADERVVVLESADEAGREAAALIAGAAADLPAGTVLVVIHSGGGRAKALAGRLRELGARVHEAAPVTKAGPLAAFVRSELRDLQVTADGEIVAALLEAVGSDLRELSAACSQLVADTGGRVDAAAVRRYHSGRAEVSGFEIADKAVTGDVAGAAEAVRWALVRGVSHVLVADALAEAVHAIARVGPLSGHPKKLAGEIGMHSWRIEKAQKQARRWSRDRVATAIGLVAALNGDVKGGAADADYVLEVGVRRVAELALGR